jgi:energy-coupling factor transporter ATP-binding protein EcfA2
LTQTVDVVTTHAVECVDLSYQFATHLAVDHVNLSIAPGEMYGLLGPNGAGKTTTIRMITTLLTPGTGIGCSWRRLGLQPVARMRRGWSGVYISPGLVTHAHGMRFRPLFSHHRRLVERVQQRWSPIVFRAHLNALELSALVAIPAGTPNVAGLPKGRSRYFAADHHLPREGLVVARSNYSSAPRPIALTAHELLKHTHIQGKTGAGKSAFMVNLAVTQAAAGYGVGLIDPTGDSTTELLERIPEGRIGDVVDFDPTDTDHPVGFNLFAGVENPRCWPTR